MTIKDIAKICDVSVSTVSRAINNSPDINYETKKHIMEVVKKHNYSPNNNARNLKINETHTIAVLIKGITNSFFSSMLKVFEKEIYKRKYNFLLHRVEENEDEADVALIIEREKKISGIIFLGGYFSNLDEKLGKLEVPFVLATGGISDKADKSNYSYVMVDDYIESYKMVDYLCKLGHKKIVLICAPPDEESIGRLRYKGYRKALDDNNIEIDENLICFNKYKGIETFSMDYGYRITKDLLKANKEFTAIFAISDTIAIGASKAIFKAGYNIPEDYSIAGYDGIDLGYFYEPSITTIKQPTEEMAEESIKVLFDIINREYGKKNTIFPATLVEGESARKI